MVNYKKKYLKYKLKYSNLKNGGMNLEEDLERMSSESEFDRKVDIINTFLEYNQNRNVDSLDEDFEKVLRNINLQLHPIMFSADKIYYYENTNNGWALNWSAINDNPKNIDFNQLENIIKILKYSIPEINIIKKWNGNFSDVWDPDEFPDEYPDEWYDEDINLIFHHDLDEDIYMKYESPRLIKIPMSLINTEYTIQNVKDFISEKLNISYQFSDIHFYIKTDSKTLLRLDNNEKFSDYIEINELLGTFVKLYITTKINSESILKQKGFDIIYENEFT